MGNILVSSGKFWLYQGKGNFSKAVLALRNVCVSTQRKLCRHKKALCIAYKTMNPVLIYWHPFDKDERQWLLDTLVATGLLCHIYDY